jgi:hypothetical protein
MNFVFNIHNFSIVGQNIMKPTWHTLTHQGLSTNTKSLARGTVVGRFGSGKKKQTNKQTNR